MASKRPLVIFVCLIIFTDSMYSFPNNLHDHDAQDGSEPEEIAKNSPKIKSKPLTLAVNEGDTVTFPCEVEDLGSLSVTWTRKKGSNNAPLFIGPHSFVPNDERIFLDGTNLMIKNVNQTDSGAYSCKVATDKDISVHHTFFVNGLPQILKEPSNGKIVLTKGQTLKLTCKSDSAEPKPDIKWEKIGSKLSISATNQEVLIIPNVGRTDAGQYRCSAFSFYGRDNHADFNVMIEEGPEIELPEANVYTGIGEEIKLRCKVYGNPSPVVFFENPRNQRLLANYKTEEYETTINIKDENDFGKYRCAAHNRFNREQADIEVSGRPSKPIIQNSDADFPTSGDEFELKYQVTSYSPITKVTVMYRSSKDMENFSDWNKTEIDPKDSNGPSYNMKYILQNMDRNTYEVRVYAENKYGRSEGSEVYSITADGAKEHWKVAGSSSYPTSSSSFILSICSLLLLATITMNSKLV